MLILENVVYSYECMDYCKIFNETSLLEKEKFYRNIKTEDIIYVDCKRVKRVCKGFEIKKLRWIS